MRKTNMLSFLRDESGATSIEYALIASIVSLSIIVGLTQISGTLQSTLNGLAPALRATAP